MQLKRYRWIELVLRRFLPKELRDIIKWNMIEEFLDLRMKLENFFDHKFVMGTFYHRCYELPRKIGTYGCWEDECGLTRSCENHLGEYCLVHEDWLLFCTFEYCHDCGRRLVEDEACLCWIEGE